MMIQLKRLRESAIMPTYGSEGAGCFDLYASEDIDVRSGETKKVPLGFAMGIPAGYEVVIRPRSGMSLKTKVRLSNSPGTIDCDYRGEIMIIVDNIGDKMYQVKAGDRIAQGKMQRFERSNFVFVESLSPTDRGEGGMGSTGT